MAGQNKQTGFTGFGNLSSTSAAPGTGFSFGTGGTGLFGSTSTQQAGSSSTSAAGQSQGTSGFSFAAKPTLFGTPTASSAAPSTGLTSGFGQGASGLGFGTGAAKPSLFGTPTASSAAPSTGLTSGFGQGASGLGFGTGAAKPTLLGTSTATTSAPSTGLTSGFGQGAPSLSTGLTSGFGQGASGLGFGTGAAKPTLLGTSTATTSAPSTGLTSGFGQGAPSLSLGAATTIGTAKPSAGLAFGTQPSQPSSTSATPASTATSSTAATGFTFGSLQPTASTQAPGLTLGSAVQQTSTASALLGTQPLLGSSSQPATTTSSASLGLIGKSSTVQPFGLAQTATTTTTKATSTLQPATSTATASATTEKPFTYKQLEDIINKWVHELEEQENVFLNQAKQVNVWDRLLIENGEKITQLNDEIERLKTDQSRLDRELDFILSQQQELEEILAPIEEQIKAQQSIPYMQHTDLEREKTYKMAENIDVQLKRMMQDIKDIITHINTSNVNLKENDDPMAQIAKILNSHMDSLQWVDQNAALLQRKVEDVNKQVESRRRDHERSIRLTFD